MNRKELLKFYSSLQGELKRKMLELILSGKADKRKIAELRRVNKQLHDQAITANSRYADTTLVTAFTAGAGSMISGSNRRARRKLKKKGVTSSTSTPIVDSAKELAKESKAGMALAVKEGQKSTVKQFRQLIKIRDEFGTGDFDDDQLKRLKIALKAFGISDKKTNQMARAKKFEEVARGLMRDKNGAYMFTDKGGRRWSYKRWSQMTTRSLQDQTKRNGFIETAKLADEDLSLIIDHPDESDSCRPYENMVISLTGKTKGYPTFAELQGNEDHIFSITCRHQLRTLSPSEKDNA